MSADITIPEATFTPPEPAVPPMAEDFQCVAPPMSGNDYYAPGSENHTSVVWSSGFNKTTNTGIGEHAQNAQELSEKGKKSYGVSTFFRSPYSSSISQKGLGQTTAEERQAAKTAAADVAAEGNSDVVDEKVADTVAQAGDDFTTEYDPETGTQQIVPVDKNDPDKQDIAEDLNARANNAAATEVEAAENPTDPEAAEALAEAEKNRVETAQQAGVATDLMEAGVSKEDAIETAEEVVPPLPEDASITSSATVTSSFAGGTQNGNTAAAFNPAASGASIPAEPDITSPETSQPNVLDVLRDVVSNVPAP